MITSRFEGLSPADYALPAGVEERWIGPGLVIYLDRVRRNVRRVIELAGGPDRWRAHLKTGKVPEVYRELVRAGLRRFKCATTREAAVMLDLLDEERVEDADLLLAFPLIGPSRARLERLARRHRATRVSLLCEDPGEIASIAPELSVFVDVNPGMNRTGVPLGEQDVIVEIARRSGERFRGVHFYDGQIHGPGAGRRTAEAHGGYDRLMRLVRRLRDDGATVGEIVTSGTPSFSAALDYAPFRDEDALGGGVHRVSPGTVVLHDLRSEQEIEELDLEPAALVACRVVSRPAHDIVTCDAGSKALAAEAGDPCAWVLGRPGLEALTPSEEHLPLRVHDSPVPRRGALLLLVPRHVCPTVNLADEALLVDGGTLRAVARVRARGHELLSDS